MTAAGKIISGTGGIVKIPQTHQPRLAPLEIAEIVLADLFCRASQVPDSDFVNEPNPPLRPILVSPATLAANAKRGDLRRRRQQALVFGGQDSIDIEFG